MVDHVASTKKLHRILLSWDYFELCEKADEGGGVFDNLEPVPDTFRDINHYKQVYEPLVLEECCSQILRGVEEGEVLNPHMAVVATHEHKDDFLYVRLALNAADSELYSDNDLVLLCKDNPMGDDVRSELSAMGYCEGHEGEQSVRVKFFLTDESQAGNVAGTARVRAMRSGLETPKSCWWLLRLSNMSTITREWIALQHAHICPFVDILMSARPRALQEAQHMDIPPGMKATMEGQCNPSQMAALRAGLDGTPAVLIQGPPGTGKTRTILNLLSVIMHSAHKGSLELLTREAKNGGEAGGTLGLGEDDKARLWQLQAPWLSGPNPRDEMGVFGPAGSSADDCFGLNSRKPALRVGRNSGPKAHVLVCAPSNSALDEIVIRILKSGLMDGSGNMYAPSVVRIGVNVHHSVKSVSIDAIVDSRLGADQDAKGLSRLERDRMRLAILDEASIVCSTLSFAGSSIFYRLSRKFDVVVIDEAAQAVEPSTLVPLVMGAKQVYMVGDPVQLPATVISTRAVDHNYDCSLFKRLQGAGYPVHVLNMQYRMHPAISAFPSREFYQGRLLDGEGVEAETSQGWHKFSCFGPLAFFDVAGKESVPPGGASIMNKAEAHLVLVIYRELVHRFPNLRKTPSVGVISPYKAQVKLLRQSFTAALGEEGARMVDINTIDGFQGREKDVILFSCVRSLKKGRRPGSIGFVADERRINVGITRSRCSLIIIGNCRALQYDGHWANLIHHSMTTSCMYRPSPPYADWMSSVLAGQAGAVTPTEQELATLDKYRHKLEGHAPEEEEALLADEDVAEPEMDEGTLAGVAEAAEEEEGKAAAAPADFSAAMAAAESALQEGSAAGAAGKRKADDAADGEGGQAPAKKAKK